MNKIGLIFTLILFIGLSGYISGLFYIMVHEDAHIAVFYKYEIDSASQYNYLLLSAATIPNIEQYNERCNDYCKSDQLNIDAVGYHIALFIFAIHLLTLSTISFYILFIKPKGLNTPVS
jgi:hypothetical protein